VGVLLDPIPLLCLVDDDDSLMMMMMMMMMMMVLLASYLTHCYIHFFITEFC